MARKSKKLPEQQVAVAVAENEETEVEQSIEATIQDEEAAANPIVEIDRAPVSVTQRCQDAKEMGACACRCRGKYHAAEHPAGWKEEAGCEPLNPDERKAAKRDTLKSWRRAHPDRVSTYMKDWRQTSTATTAVNARAAAERTAAKKLAEQQEATTPTEVE